MKFNLKWPLRVAELFLFCFRKEISNPDAVTKNAAAIANANVNVYLAGRENEIPIYWKNDNPVHLTSRNSQTISGIAVLGNDVYVGGKETTCAFGSTHTRSLYWKNDSIVILDNYAYTSSIAVSGNDVYFSGYRQGPIYWKNGNAVSLAQNSTSIYISSIVVSGTNVYVTGYENKGSFSITKYWKNGIAVNLSNVSSSANSIYITNQ